MTAPARYNLFGRTGHEFERLFSANAKIDVQVDPSHVVEHTADLRSKRTRILLVDDEIDFWWGPALKTLISAGYKVDIAEDGEAAWQVLRAEPYDLLITDNRMPKIWGLELIQRLRSAAINLPVIFASTSLPAEELKQHPELHIDSTMEKPIKSSELLQAVDRALRHDGPPQYPEYLAEAI